MTLIFAIGACLTAGVQVLQRDGIAAVDINAVVRRVKCALNKIVVQKAYQEILGEIIPERRYLFLRSWGAKVRLALVIDDNAQVSRGASHTAPLRAVIGVAQSFTLWIGGGLTTQAIPGGRLDSPE